VQLAIPSFARNLFFPPGAKPLVREPNRRWARGSAASKLLRLKVAEIIEETPSTRTFVFEDKSLAYRAGQHLTLVERIEGRTVRRCYSFSSSPSAGARPSITVKRVEGGLMSNWLHDHVRVGDVLRASPASGRFTIDDELSGARHCVMVAGGVGITPLLSMAETTLREDPRARVTLLYGSRSEDEIIFRDRLAALASQFHERLDVRLALDDVPEYAEASSVALPASPATLVFRTSGVTAIARTGTTILEAAEQAGVALPSSCRMGGCGACKVKIEGRVVAAEPNCLSEQERAENYVLACCSYGDGRVEIRDF